MVVCGEWFGSLQRWQFRIINKIVGGHKVYTRSPTDRDDSPMNRDKLLNYAQCEAVCSIENPSNKPLQSTKDRFTRHIKALHQAQIEARKKKGSH